MTVERRYTELRHDSGRRIAGVAVRYGDVAQLPWGRERFGPLAFAPLGDVILNTQHDRRTPLARTDGGGLVLHDSPTELRIEAALPKTQAADDALELVKAGVFRGLSMEFQATSERMEGGVRVIDKAVLSGVAIVDTPAYPASEVEARRRGDRGGRLASYRGHVPAGKALECRCGPGDCREALFESGALDGAIAKGQQKDVLAVVGDYANAIGSQKRKSLRFWSDGKGGLNFAVDVPNTERGRALIETFDQVDVIGRPVIDTAESAFVREGTLAKYSRATVRAITLGPTDAAQGWSPLVALKPGDPGYDAVPDAPVQRRARIWL